MKSDTTLKDQALNTLMSFSELGKKPLPKMALESIYATLIYPNRYQTWKESGPITDETNIEDIGTTTWFAHAEYNRTREKYEAKTIDAEHLLVNNRVFVTKKGLNGVSKNAWQDVATRYPDILSRATIFDLIDRQSCQRAKEVFHEHVEAKMRELGYTEEANYCHIIREWYEAEDNPALNPIERCRRWFALKTFLLDGVCLDQFPPHGKYVKGLPRIQFEGFLQRIDVKIQLYGILETPYNQRAIGTLVNETFFGELTEMEPCKLGCPKAVNMHRMMRNVIELMHYRHSPRNR